MDQLTEIKNGIERLYRTNPHIHISVTMSRPRIIVEGTPAVITGVYKNIFQIEACDSGRPVRHTLQYGDVLIGQVVIRELDFVPMVSILKK